MFDADVTESSISISYAHSEVCLGSAAALEPHFQRSGDNVCSLVL
jgi:hypothetical protein